MSIMIAFVFWALVFLAAFVLAYSWAELMKRIADGGAKSNRSGS